MSLYTNKLINEINEKIKNNPPKVCIPDGEDQRIIDALSFLENMEVILLGDPSIIKPMLANAKIPSSVVVEVYQPQVNEVIIERIVDVTKDFKKPITMSMAREWCEQAPSLAMMLLKLKLVDCVVGGSSYPTSAILSPMLKLIKAKTPSRVISSYMLLQREGETLIFSDCALNVKPTEEQQVQIIEDTITSAKNLGIDPYVGVLSYSTLGSGAGEDVDRVKQAMELYFKKHPQDHDFVVGEVQFDAAYDSRVANIKLKDQALSKPLNTFIFPDLNSGNIGYKIAQYLGKFEAIGPIIQGASQPVNDLSRGATPQEIAKVIYLTIAGL